MMEVEMSPVVGPVSPYEQPVPSYQIEFDLCELLQTMSLSQRAMGKKDPNSSVSSADCVQSAPLRAEGPSVTMPEDQSDTLETSNSTSCDLFPSSIISPNTTVTSPPPCPYLQSILASLAPTSPVLYPFPNPYPCQDTYETTTGAYLDTILTHRALLAAYPPAHAGCSVAFSEIARALETRAWRADRDADGEALRAFRWEAHVVAMWI